jgi:hypothetical protein
MNKFIASILMSAATFTDPTTPKALPFNASAFVNSENQIRLSINKETDIPLVILLRDKQNGVLLRQVVSKKEHTYAAKFIVNELADGEYELEVMSKEGSFRKQIKLETKSVRTSNRVIAMQ